MGRHQGTVAERARTWTAGLASAEGLERCQALLGTTAVAHLDGMTTDWSGLRCLLAAYSAVFPTEAVEITQVATWADRAMVAFTISHRTPWAASETRRATALLRLEGNDIAEVWLIDDWLAWLSRYGAL